MMTIHDAGTPRDADLPVLDASQLDALTAELTRPRDDVTERAAGKTVSAGATRRSHRSRWRAPSLVAAAVALLAVALFTFTTAGDRSAGQPLVAEEIQVLQRPAPNFECVVADKSQLTRSAAFLPWVRNGNDYATVGLTDDGLCVEYPGNGGGMSMSARSSAVGSPLVYFSTSGPADQSAYPTEMAFGIVDNSVTRIEFAPAATGAPSTGTSTFVSLGGLRAFALPYGSDGMIKVYAGDAVVAQETALTSPDSLRRADLAPTGLPCDATAPAALANASRIAIDFPGGSLEAEIYLDAVTSVEPTATAPRSLCLLVATANPVLAGIASPTNAIDGIGYLATTKVAGGKIVWGRLEGSAQTIWLIESAGNKRQPSSSSFDTTRTGSVPFAVFVADGEPGVVAAQGLDANWAVVGPVFAIN